MWGFVALSYFVTREEHQTILAFIERAVGGEQPPMDIEADAIIRALFVRNPEAAYRVTMLAMSLAAASVAAEPVHLTRAKTWLSTLFDRREVVAARRNPIIS